MRNKLKQIVDILKPDTLPQQLGIGVCTVASAASYWITGKLFFENVLLSTFFYDLATYHKMISTRSIETKRKLFNNFYSRHVVDPIVKELYKACISLNADRHPCGGGRTMLSYKRFGPAQALLVAPGSLEQYENNCKRECFICLEDAYDPLMISRAAILIGIYKLSNSLRNLKNRHAMNEKL
jgi:hypothetical protein